MYHCPMRIQPPWPTWPRKADPVQSWRTSWFTANWCLIESLLPQQYLYFFDPVILPFTKSLLHFWCHLNKHGFGKTRKDQDCTISLKGYWLESCAVLFLNLLQSSCCSAGKWKAGKARIAQLNWKKNKNIFFFIVFFIQIFIY